MTRTIETLAPHLLDEAAQAGQWQLAQLNLRGGDPEGGYKKAGLPNNGRVLVVIGFQGCLTHDFAELEKKAKANNATLYVINGNPNEPGSEAKNYKPSINIPTRSADGKATFRPLDGVIITAKNTADKSLSIPELLKIANMLGMPVSLSDGGVETISSTGNAGIKLFENGKPLDLIKKAEILMPARALARA